MLAGGAKMAQQKRLFDCVLVVGVNAVKAASDASKNPPYVKFHFPYPPSFMKAVTQFCFPDSCLDKMKSKQEEIFSFVLTESNGEKRWGYCHRVFPQCFCIVSYLPCFSIFSKILKKVIKLHQNAPPGMPFSACTMFLRAIYEQPLPQPGGTLQFTVEYPATSSAAKKAKTEHYTFRRPDDSDSLLDHVNFRPLVTLLSPDNILAAFASLLVERRIIFISERVSTLSACVQACVAILYPFSWQHVFIPVLPASLLSFCCAPMPFVVGVLRSSVEELQEMSRNMEDVVIVDLDDDRVIPPGSQDTDAALLPPFVAPLRATIEDVSKRTRNRMTLTNLSSNSNRKLPKDSTAALSNAFIGFMVDLLASYRDYIVISPGSADEGSFPEFNREGFLENAVKETRPLLELITETQMFSMFIEQRGAAQIDNGVFDRGITGKSPDTERAAVSSGEARTSQRMRPAHTRFTMYEYGNITRSEISAVHEMIREHTEKTKKDIDEQESLELLRKWREEEKKRKESATKAAVEAPERKSTTTATTATSTTTPTARGGFSSIRVSVSSDDNYRGSTGSRQSFLAASRMPDRSDSGARRATWKRAHVSPAPSPVSTPPSSLSTTPTSAPTFHIPSPASSPSSLGLSKSNAFVRSHSSPAGINGNGPDSNDRPAADTM